MIWIESNPQKGMNEDAINRFPDECCGFFFGQEAPDGRRIITDWLSAKNAKTGDKTRRFEIAAQDYMRAEEYAMQNELLLLGIYHSHPKHPAVPSEHDRLAAQPYFSYVIISVTQEGKTTFRSWRLNDESQFEEEKISEPQNV